MNEALEATHQLQQGKPGYMALWNHIMQVSVTDLKRNYSNLNVSFDLWKKESDAQPYIPDMVQMMKDQGFAYEDQGALVVDVKEDTDRHACFSNPTEHPFIQQQTLQRS
jgi:arginyl-tRNA synthetase